MNRTRIALLGLTAVLVAVWVSSATLPPPPSPAPTPPAATAKRARAAHQSASTRSRDVTSFDLNDAAERLHARLAAAARSRPTERNPFEFAHTAPPRALAMPAAPPIADPASAGPLPPPFALTGVAEQKKADDVLVRTAILTGNNQIYFAKAGDQLLGRYEVTAVGADAIELRELDGGRIIRLGLR